MSSADPEGDDGGAGDQLALIRERVRRAPRPRRTAAATQELAAERPVARVALDVPLAHLDRPFDYLVPASMAATAVPGARVRVRLAGAEAGGFVLERCEASAHEGRLSRLARVVSPEPVLTDEVARTARAVADRYAGTLADVLRLAVPPRHARVEAERPATGDDTEPGAGRDAQVPEQPGHPERPERPGHPERPERPERPEPGSWAAYPDGPGFLAALASGGAPRAAWTALPVTTADPFDALARALLAVAASGRGSLAIVPTQHDLGRLEAVLTSLAPTLPVSVLSAELGPAERYRRWLAVRRGQVRTVVGTRGAVWAPVADLGLVACWDDGDDLHAEPRAPYPHVREVLALRAHEAGAAALLGAHLRTAEVQALVERRWLRPLEATRRDARRAAPRVRVAGDDHEQARDPAARAARLPSIALRTARTGLATGPVLVQVAQAGYTPALACATCRMPARCIACHGPLTADRTGALRCGWCAAPEPSFVCPSCAGTQVRATRVGARRTAEELGRAFPGVPVRTSGRDGLLDGVGAGPALIVATPGAEPVAADGYAAGLLLDGDLQLARPALRAGEEALRRWFGAAALVRAGAPVVLVADDRAPWVQALVRWDPSGSAARELADRTATALPPAVVVAELEGATDDLDDALRLLELPAGATVLGPLPVRGDDTRRRALARAAPGSPYRTLTAALQAVTAVRSAGKRGGHVRVRVDPVDLA